MKESLEEERDYAQSKLLFHPSFNETISEINNMKLKLPNLPSKLDIDFESFSFPPNGKLVSSVEEIKQFSLDPHNGCGVSDEFVISAYDESIIKFQGLQGTAYLTSHSLILHGQHDFLPSNLLTLYFYTRSEALSRGKKYVKHSVDPEIDSKRDYVSDRKLFLTKGVPDNSVVLIDGPLIGAQMTSYTLELNDLLLNRNVIPIFFVKNSTSNLLTDNFESLKGNFNSDLHWAYEFLKTGERTNLFRYVDQEHKEWAKVFCYIKTLDASPQRIEMDIKTFERHSDRINELFDLIYFLLLVQGDSKNPQVRSIAVAEKFARSSLKLVDFVTLMRNMITPTMNQERFAW